ncbi:MAG: ferric reductase-like transmembrane domain-containing protein [Sulfitobacter sp.]
MTRLASQYTLWLLLALPGLFLVLAWKSDFWTYGQVVSKSGLWSAQLLILTLAVTPLRRVFGATGPTRFLLRRRRDFGIATFLYGLLHTIVYLVQKAEIGRILAEAQEFWLAAGWIAILIFGVLAAISNDFFVRKLRQNWKRLQRLVYAAAVLTFVHWTISAFDPLTAYVHIAVLLGIEAVRFIPRRA